MHLADGPEAGGRRRGTAPAAPSSGYYRPQGLELAAGWVFGAAPAPRGQHADDGEPFSPRGGEGRTRRTLERLLLEQLAQGPVAVLFSGGRDSSALLALTVHVARREGLRMPVPFTLRFPDDVESDESWWQDRVLEHLGVRDREVVHVTDEQRLLGDVALDGLRRRGLVFPAAVQWETVRLTHLRGHRVITGEGGDELLARRRGTPVHLLGRTLASGRRPSRRLAMEVADALRPRWSIRPEQYRQVLPPWLTEAASRTASAGLARDQRAPLRWDRATRRLPRSRATAVVLDNLDLVAREHDVVYCHPFADPRVVGALAADGGWWGYAGRTDLFRRLFGDLLPDDVLSRTTKARFNGTRWGERERDFARRWDGTGVDHDLVDVSVLRDAWTWSAPPFAAELLLQAAWLAQQRTRTTS